MHTAALATATTFDAAARRAVYSGRIIVFRNVPAMSRLCALASSMLTDFVRQAPSLSAFPVASGEELQSVVSVDRGALVDMCARFEASDEAVGLWRQALAQVGVEAERSAPTETTLWDRARLRIVPSGDRLDDVSSPLHGCGKYSSTLPLHRDTWGSQLAAQCNWWAPLLPLDARRTLALHPRYFDRPLPPAAVTQWDYAELRRCRKAGEAYPQLPYLNRDALDAAERAAVDAAAQPLSEVHPGDLVVFSGAHLHGSVLNTTGVPRVSTEVRTIHVADWAAGIGAPVVDGPAVEVEAGASGACSDAAHRRDDDPARGAATAVSLTPGLGWFRDIHSGRQGLLCSSRGAVQGAS